MIYDYRSYKRYLEDQAQTHPHKKGRGFKAALAQAASCQATYVSQVLGGPRHFTFEQAEGINRFLGHDEDESRFLLLLLGYERAGTPHLRERYEGEIKREVERRRTLKDRFKVKDSLSSEAQATYYSAWYYAAIHVGLTLSSLRTKEALARAFGLPIAAVAKVLEFLVECGLADRKGSEFHPGAKNIYLGSDSPLISQHHVNWRMRAIASLDPNLKDDLHYSAVVSIEAEDYRKIRELLTTAIENARKCWVDAKNENQLCGVVVDCFKIRAQ